MRVFFERFMKKIEEFTNNISADRCRTADSKPCETTSICRRAKAGFTLAEVLIVVAIMAILSGFGFVAVTQYNKRLTLLEMDDTAKKIFLAAQNHLTVSETSGAWKQLVAETESTPKSADSTRASLGIPGNFINDIDEKYKVIFGGEDISGNGGNNVSDAMNLILPPNAVDIAGDGTYAIIYDPSTATIYGVYYSSSSTFGNGQDTYNFADEIKNVDRSDDSSKRLDHTPLIGYYGNATGTTKTPGTDLKALEKIKVWFENNAEDLTLHISDPNKLDISNMELIVTGESSKKEITFSFKEVAATDPNASKKRKFASDSNKNTLFVNHTQDDTESTILFDSLSGKHFKDLMEGYYPGENITAQVILKDVASGAIITGEATDNSLYEQTFLSPAGNSSGTYAARVKYLRHLENLSTLISGISTNSSPAFSIKKAILTQNIDLSRVGLISIVPDTALEEFDGNGKTLSNMSTSAVTDTTLFKGNGLFSNIDRDSSKPGFSIRNLTLEAPTVTDGSSVPVGTLIGYFKGDSLSINNVMINGNPENIPGQSGIVKGSADAGGMIGQIDGVNNCKVDIWNSKVSGIRIIAQGGNAGGFVGNANGLKNEGDSGTFTIVQSKFIEPINVNPNGFVNEDNYDIYANSGSAGGLIGACGFKELDANSKKTIKYSSFWNCTILNCEVSSNHRFNISAGKQVGGIIGGFYGGSLQISGTLAAGKYMWIRNSSSGGNTDGSCAGGFIGEGNVKKTASVSIQNCGAGAYVYAVDADCAGGLIGSLKSGTKSLIKDTYVSGHTNNGQFMDKIYDGTVDAIGGYNVFGCTATGGFIGYTSANNLTVENCSTAASTYTNTQLDDKHRHGIIGGFVGQTQYAVTTNFNNCYAAGKTFSNGENFAGYGGSFIGQINNKEKKKINNVFKNDYVLTGVEFNDGQTYGGETLNTLSDAEDKKMLKGEIHAVTVAKLRAIDFYKPVEKTNAFDLPNLKNKSYPYSITTQLPDYTNDKYDIAFCKRWYVGDWAEPKAEERDQTYDGNFGVLYYEIVQHGDTGTKDYYYHGFVGSLTEDGSRKDYQEVSTNDVDDEILNRPNNRNGLLIGHNEYVVEEGYLVLVSTKYTKDHVREWRNQNNQLESNELAIYITTPGTGIDYGKARIGSNPYVKKYEGMCDHLHLKGYDVYCIDSEKLTDLGAQSSYLNVALKAYINDTKNPNGNDPIEWARFNFQPIFSDTLSLDDEPSPDEYKIRSAKQMKLIFEKGGNTYNAINNGHKRIKQTLDISFSKELQFSKFDWESGAQIVLSSEDFDYTNKNDNPYNSATISSQMNFTYYASTPYEERNGNMPADKTDNLGNGDNSFYRLQNLNRPFSSGSIGNQGLIEKLIVENADSSYFLQGNLEGTLNNCKFINCDFTEAPIYKINNGNITNCDVINGQMGRAGLIGTIENSGNVSGCHIYGDKNIAQGNNTKEYSIHNTGFTPNPHTVDNTVSNDQYYGYNLVTVGLNPNTKPDDGTNLTNGGLIAQCSSNSGTIEDCSFTGKVYGKIAAGFMGEASGNNITIRRCYANAVITGYERAAGLIGEVKQASIDQCHTVGILISNRGANGFAANFFGGNITNSYSAIWKATVGTGCYFYPFSDSANGQYSFSNCFATNDAGGVQTSGYTIVTDDQLREMAVKTSNLGVSTDTDKTVSYFQYMSHDENTYPYPMPKNKDDEMDVAYGDWYYQNILLTAKDSRGQEVNLSNLIINNDSGITISVQAVQSGKNISADSKWTIEQNGELVTDSVASITKNYDNVAINLKQLGIYTICVSYSEKTARQLCVVKKLTGLRISTEPSTVSKGDAVSLIPLYIFADGTSATADFTKLQWTVSYNGGTAVSVTPDSQGKIIVNETGNCLITATDTELGQNASISINVLEAGSNSSNEEVALQLTNSWDGNKQYYITLKNNENHKVDSITVTLYATGTVTGVSGGVNGTINGTIVTVTCNNYGNGFEAGATGTFFMHVTGNGDFSVSVNAPTSPAKQNSPTALTTVPPQTVTKKIRIRQAS